MEGNRGFLNDKRGSGLVSGVVYVKVEENQVPRHVRVNGREKPQE